MSQATRKRPDRRREWLPEGFGWIPGASRAISRLQTREEVEQYVVIQAQRAHNLLNDDTFNEAFQELQDSMAEQLMATLPGQAEEREDLYYRIRGLQDLVATLNGWVNRYNAMVESKKNANVSP